MRAISRIFVSLALALPLTVLAAEQTVALKVAGNCAMCKKRIEKAAESVSGVKEASWDKKKKILTAVFEDTQTSTSAISTAVLEAGYDVDSTVARRDAYDKLPECCQYR
jgi:mercuric ion binding protein